MHTTNYVDTFIETAPDSPVDRAVEPPAKEQPTIAQLHYELMAQHPYELTSDDVVFTTYARRSGIAEADWPEARAAFFSKGQPCLRSSPLGKRYGWGVHSDAAGRVALVARESDEYERLASATDVAHTRAMRSARA